MSSTVWHAFTIEKKFPIWNTEKLRRLCHCRCRRSPPSPLLTEIQRNRHPPSLLHYRRTTTTDNFTVSNPLCIEMAEQQLNQRFDRATKQFLWHDSVTKQIVSALFCLLNVFFYFTRLSIPPTAFVVGKRFNFVFIFIIKCH